MQILRTTLVRLGALALATLGTGCTTTLSSRPIPKAGVVEGVPYFLPTSIIEITLSGLKGTAGKQEDLLLEATPRLVPDAEAGFVLETSGNWFYERKQSFSTKDSMLTLVSTKDVSKIKEFISSLAGTAANVFSFGQIGGIQAAGASNPQDLRNDEILAIYGLVAPGKHQLSLSGPRAGSMAVPGTAGKLILTAIIDTATGPGPVVVPLPAPAGAPAPAPAGSNEPEDSFAGIYTRVMVTREVGMSLAVDMEFIYLDRVAFIEKSEKAIKSISDKIVKDETAHRAASSKLEKEKLAAAIKAGKKSLAAAKSSLALYVTSRGTKANNRAWALSSKGLIPTEIAKRRASVLAPDETRLVKIPIRSSVMGTSANQVTLVSGVLTEYRTERPSEALEFISIPLDLSKSLLELPAMIFQLKIDYTNKTKELLEAEQSLDDLATSIAAGPTEPTAHEMDLLKLQQRAVILKLEKEIAELRVAIDDLESAD